MPLAFKAGDVSMVKLFRQSGYLDSPVSEQDIEAFLRSAPDLVEVWVRYSQDQRSSPAPYLAPPHEGLEPSSDWRVGYYTGKEHVPEEAFGDEFSACACFVKRVVEQLRARPG